MRNRFRDTVKCTHMASILISVHRVREWWSPTYTWCISLRGRVRQGQMFTVCPIIKWVHVSDWAFIYFIFFMNESRRHPVSVGYRISQPLWQIENRSASLRRVTHFGSWQENERTDKRVPLWEEPANCCRCSSCKWRIAKIAAQLRGAGLSEMRKHRREITRKICWNV